MEKGLLSQYFVGVAAKRLSLVEVSKKASNQHEFNGSEALKRLLGTNDFGTRYSYPAKFIWMGDENETVLGNGNLSWYDARYGNTKRNAEWRLYFPTTDVSERAVEGDLLIIALRPDNSILSIIAPGGSTTENQLLWLFGVAVQHGHSFVSHTFDQSGDKPVDLTAQFILEELGIEIEEKDEEWLDSLIAKFGYEFPKTKEFSELARRHVKPGVDPVEDPDGALMAWMEFEEKLFRALEKKIIAKRLSEGFVNNGEVDVEGFVSFSLSVQNRRKARAGFAMELHLEEIFKMHGITYDRTAVTENRSKPDFLFPGAEAYRDMAFPENKLAMLGVKTTCKDRWRQVLSEAKRIYHKHLITLEPGISENQTREMQDQHLQLVLPVTIHQTYNEMQRKWLMSLKEFLGVVKANQ